MHDDDPGDAVHDAVRARRCSADAPLGRPVIGTVGVDQLADPRTDRAATTARRYQPENMVVAAAGNLDHATVVRLVRKAFGKAGLLADALRAVAARTPVGGTGRRSRSGVTCRAGPSEQANVRPRRARRGPDRRPALRARGAQRSARRRHVEPALPGGPREARASPTRSTRTPPIRGRRLFGVYAGCTPGAGRRGARLYAATSWRRSPSTASLPRSSAAARASCAAGSCWASRTPGRG